MYKPGQTNRLYFFLFFKWTSVCYQDSAYAFPLNGFHFNDMINVNFLIRFHSSKQGRMKYVIAGNTFPNSGYDANKDPGIVIHALSSELKSEQWIIP